MRRGIEISIKKIMFLDELECSLTVYSIHVRYLSAKVYGLLS